MNITENLNRIQQAKSDIRAAIIQKGGTVSEDAKIDEYAGVIESLPSGDDTLDKIFSQTLEEIHSTTPIKCGRYLFYNQPNLKIADVLLDNITSTYQYQSMFRDCKALTRIPELPATTLTDYCYYYMFYGCTALTRIPELPVMNIQKYSCYCMFYNSGITEIPNIEAKTVGEYGMSYMFGGCNNLTTVGNLNFKSVSKESLEYMFSGCNNLTTVGNITVTDKNSGSEYPLRYMFKNCTNLNTVGDFDFEGYEMCQAMFEGCTSLTTVGDFKRASVGAYQCFNMFNGCTSLTTAPDLPATSLAQYCYQYMFNGCTSLTTAPDLPATTLASGCYQYMFQGCTSLQKTGKIYATGSISSYASYMFSGCTSLREMTWMATTPPTINANIWTNCPSDMIIYVPDGSVNAYKAANVWKTRATYIKPMSEKPTE